MSQTTAAAQASDVPRPRHFYTEPEWLEVSGLQVAYRRKGDGPATLYLHGAGLTRMWLPFYESLSEWLDAFDDLAIHYDSLLDALELERVHVVGYSLGGWVAAELAVFYPHRLESLTLITPAGLRVPGKPPADIFAMEPETLFAVFFNDPTNAMQVLPDFESLDEIEHQFGEAATLARLAWNPRFDPKLERRLGRVDCPTLVVCAEEDRMIPREIAERYAELIDGARIETVPDTGHGLIVEQPEKTAEVVSAFIQEQS